MARLWLDPALVNMINSDGTIPHRKCIWIIHMIRTMLPADTDCLLMLAWSTFSISTDWKYNWSTAVSLYPLTSRWHFAAVCREATLFLWTDFTSSAGSRLFPPLSFRPSFLSAGIETGRVQRGNRTRAGLSKHPGRWLPFKNASEYSVWLWQWQHIRLYNNLTLGCFISAQCLHTNEC